MHILPIVKVKINHYMFREELFAIYKLWYMSQIELFYNSPPEDMEKINKWTHHAKIRKHTIIQTARDGSGWTLLYNGRRLTPLYCQ